MHYGNVNSALEAGVALVLLGDTGATEQADFIIDTGFSGGITLATDIFDRLNLQRDDDVAVTLGDGTVRALARYTARLLWHGRRREIEAVRVESDELLIGMRLLQGSSLHVEAVPGGLVAIAELPGSS